VSFPTHVNGNTLDLVVNQTSSALSVNVTNIDWSVSSDHSAILCNVTLPKPVRPKKTVSVRKWKTLDIGSFNQDIMEYDMSSVNSCDIVSRYNIMLSCLLDKHAPLETITVTDRPSSPWYNQDVRHAKTQCRKFERQWRKSQLTIDWELYVAQKSLLRSIRERAKTEYVMSKLNEATTSRDTFAVLNTLLQKKAVHPLPDYDDQKDLAEQFAMYFQNKIAAVRQVFDPADNISNSHDAANLNILDSFQLVSENDVQKLISASASKSCALDPIPTWLLKKSPAIIPLLSNLINDSLSKGYMPSDLKNAHVVPALKKASLDRNIFKNYRPISNLAYSSKLIERVVSSQLKEHCLRNEIDMYFQSAYREGHSTETALTRVQNDLLKAVDNQGGAVLVLLDLSAAFDTIDHQVLLMTLRHCIGVSGSALSWFSSYLVDRQQSVRIGGTLSSPKQLPYGVPQGSVLGPQLFSIYTQPLHDIIRNSGMSFHLYADDTQLYFTFNPKCSVSINEMRKIVDSCTTKIGNWMQSHFLKLNGEKTELLVLTRPTLSTNTIPSVSVCGQEILSSSCVRDLGIQYDSLLKLELHVRSVCKRAYHQIHLIRRVRQQISEEAARTLVQSNVTTLLDYCNGLLFGLPASLIDLLQRVQNSAARVIKCLPRSSHITPVLMELHWLPIKWRIHYKIVLLTFKSLHNIAPSYIKDLLRPYHPGRNLRSANDNLLCQPTYRCKSYGFRSFEVCAPSLWNNLPSSMRKIDSLEVFKRTLKTFLFNQAYTQ
jgi:hypothetical protein